MSILINKDTKSHHLGHYQQDRPPIPRLRAYANGKNCFVAGANPKKAGENFEGIPIYASVKEAKAQTGATVSVRDLIAGAAAAIDRRALTPNSTSSSVFRQ